MKVAIVCPYDLGAPGGVQDQAISLTRWLGDLGHETVLIGPGDDGPDGSILLGSTRTVTANASAVPILVDPRVVRAVRSAVGDADVVHIHEPFMPMVSLAATRIGDVPSVGTFHADASTLVRRVFRFGAPIAKVIASRLDIRTAVSPVAQSVVDRLGPIRIIPNGIDLSSFRVAEKRPMSVVFIGRDDERKGLDILLAAWPDIAAIHPEARLTVIGAKRDDPPAGVTYLGRVTDEEKQTTLSTSAIAVCPNLGGESFGIVVAEAMASGCAVVASALPAFTRVAADAGRLVRVGDVAGLADAVNQLLGDDAERRRLADAGRTRVTRFDGGEVAGMYLQAYEDAIAAHG